MQESAHIFPMSLGFDVLGEVRPLDRAMPRAMKVYGGHLRIFRCAQDCVCEANRCG